MVVSLLGDRGLVWFLVLVARWRRPGPRRTSALRSVIVTGAVVPVCNAVLKRSFGRARPEPLAPVTGLRRPKSASFPSGHSVAAWCAADLLAEHDRWAPAYYALAAAVSVSRLQVRHHHATDVVAGSVLGVAIGRTSRKLVRLRRLPGGGIGS